MECPEISAHIQELTVSAQVSCLNLDETISGQDPLRWQKLEFRRRGIRFHKVHVFRVLLILFMRDRIN